MQLNRATFQAVILGLAASFALTSCGGREDGVATPSQKGDPSWLAVQCVKGNANGECARFEALYGVDPRDPDVCARLGDKLPSCVGKGAAVKKSKAVAY